jgi:hypothetical protein
VFQLLLKMEITETEYLERARAVLAKILADVPALKVRWEMPAPVPPPDVAKLIDFGLELQLDNRIYRIAGEFKKHGFPQHLSQAIAQLLRYRYKGGRNDDLMVAAPYITPEGAKVCLDDNVSYFDLAGNCRIAMGPIYIERTGIPNPFEKNVMAAPSLYGMRGERILRILLQNPKTAWKVLPLASQAGVSAGTVSIIRKLLTARDWAKDTPEGILLTQPEGLLRDWAHVWSRRAFKVFPYFSRLGQAETERKLADVAQQQKRRLALTGAAAAWRYAPMTRYQRTQVYWEGEPEELAQAMGFKKTESGANVHILLPRDRGVFEFQEEIEGVPVVGAVQAYLDLQRDPARGQEAAEHLWQTKLFHV